MGGPKKGHSLAGISSRNRVEKVPQKPITSSALPPLDKKPKREPVLPEPVKAPVVSDAHAAQLIKDKLEGREPKEDYRENEKSHSDALPKVEVTALSEDVKKAFYGIMNMFDTFYFTVINKVNICSKKVERECLSNCQHYTYCIKKIDIKNSIKVI